MKILLLNDNPVVNKLVTLSAQKTSDELDVVDSIDSLQSGEYDLLVVDDTMYNDDMFSEIKSKIMFSKSLYICSRDAAAVEAFSSTLKKPFLPTDLVELFLMFSKEVVSGNLNEDNPSTDIDELEEFNTEEATEELVLGEDLDLSLDDELEELDDDLSLEDDELLLEDDDISLDNLSFDDELEELDDLSLGDDELLLEDDELSFDDEDLEGGESVLDDEEAQKVKDLLDETSDDETTEKIPEYDPQFAANELGLPVEEIEEFIQDFINQAYEFKDELYSSLTNNDLDNIQSLSHKLKGVAANLRMDEALDAISIINTSSESAEIEASMDDFYKIIDKLSGANTTDIGENDIATDLDELEEFNTQESELDDELLLEEDTLAETEPEVTIEEELELDEELDEELEAEELELDTEEDLELEPEIAMEEDLELDEELDLSEGEDELLLEEDTLPETEVAMEEELELDEELETGDLEEELETEEFTEELELDTEEDLELDEELDLSEEEDELLLEEDTLEEPEPEVATEEELELDEELETGDLEEELETEEFTEELELEEELDLETQIENAVEELSDEDLESELDEATLLEIATNDIDSLDDFDSLTSNDLKLAIGEEVVEEVNTEIPEISSDDTDLESFEETQEDVIASEEVEANSIEALENLLVALKDKNVTASMKGMKININITIGDE